MEKFLELGKLNNHIGNFLPEFYDRKLFLSTFRMATKRSGASLVVRVQLTSLLEQI